MASVQDVEDAVGQYDRPCKLLDRLGEAGLGDDFSLEIDRCHCALAGALTAYPSSRLAAASLRLLNCAVDNPGGSAGAGRLKPSVPSR